MWVHAFRTYNHAGQHTNNSLESYHRVLKAVFFKGVGNSKRLDWTCQQLLKSEEEYYYEHQSVINGTRRNMKEFRQEAEKRERAERIPDSDVRGSAESPGVWFVRSQSKRSVEHVVSTAGAWATCTCPMGAQMQSTCIHILKVAELQGERIRHKGRDWGSTASEAVRSEVRGQVNGEEDFPECGASSGEANFEASEGDFWEAFYEAGEPLSDEVGSERHGRRQAPEPTLKNVNRALRRFEEVMTEEVEAGDDVVGKVVLEVALHGVHQLTENVRTASASASEMQELSAKFGGCRKAPGKAETRVARTKPF
jgi:hypothetical protein